MICVTKTATGRRGEFLTAPRRLLDLFVVVGRAAAFFAGCDVVRLGLEAEGRRMFFPRTKKDWFP